MFKQTHQDESRHACRGQRPLVDTHTHTYRPSNPTSMTLHEGQGAEACNDPSQDSEQAPRPVLQPGFMAAGLVLCGSFSFSLMGLFVKLADRHTRCTPFSLLAVRSALGFVMNLVAIFCEMRGMAAAGAGVATLPGASLRHQRRSCSQSGKDCATRFGGPSTCREWIWLAVRCLGGFACISLEYKTLQALPLATNTMIVYSSPMFIVVWAAILLGEKLRLPVAICMSICFGGLLLIVQPWKHDASAPLWAYGGAAVTAMISGLVYVSLKELKKVKYHFVINLFVIVCLACSVIVGLALDVLPFPPLDNRPAWGYLCGVGVAAYAAEVFVTMGFAKATPTNLGEVSTMKFMSPVFSLVWGFVFLASSPGALQFVGMVLVLTSAGAINFLRSANHGLDVGTEAALRHNEERRTE
mmetsp:Transcript_34081/g.73657  ORF Transcript_34081/g.73657 Transcript_34081/m.73657 type:complete len:412 (+) Transcript_34081:265-1500(+)